MTQRQGQAEAILVAYDVVEIDGTDLRPEALESHSQPLPSTSSFRGCIEHRTSCARCRKGQTGVLRKVLKRFGSRATAADAFGPQRSTWMTS
jgi:hypothetical protein